MRTFAEVLKKLKRSKFCIYTLSIICLAASSCGKDKVTYSLIEVDNPEYHPNTEFKYFEDLISPKFSHLIEKYQLDTVLGAETDEFQRILLLRDWIKSVIRIENESPHYSGDGYAEGILDAALQGEGFHCSHFMRVENAVMNAYGYMTRVINAGPGVEEKVPDDNHGIDEIWSNQFDKWFLSDAKYNHHFEKNGIPLSALEIRDEYLKNKGADIIMVKGADRTPIDFDPEFGRSKESFAQTYVWPRWYMYGNRHTIYPENYNSPLLVYNDYYFDKSEYFRGGVLVDHKQIEYWKKVSDRKAIEWTPNVLDIEASISTDTLFISITSDTPNFKEYQIKTKATGDWDKIQSSLVLKLPGDEETTYFFRSINLADVAGPEAKVIVQKN